MRDPASACDGDGEPLASAAATDGVRLQLLVGGAPTVALLACVGVAAAVRRADGVLVADTDADADGGDVCDGVADVLGQAVGDAVSLAVMLADLL